ncbi:hypothetical protein BJ165DRAFT_1482248 [Panaeolus papilionaceus]|nr:hypothetical protein BJ165DRAFT_1482248 [Panaeolus papilionaceus]
MHPALQNPSIVTEIFDCFSASSPSGRADAKSCLSRALTCKQFLSPALDVIWWKLYDLRHSLGFTRGATPAPPLV